MTAFAIAKWLSALAPLLDHYDRGAPIARRAELVDAIATASAARVDAKRWAARLDVTAAYETGNADADAAGGCPGVPSGTLCLRSSGAKYCSPFMIACSRVPVGATLLEQARIAIVVIEESRAACPAHPWGQYIGVGCRASHLSDLRIAAIEREASQ